MSGIMNMHSTSTYVVPESTVNTLRLVTSLFRRHATMLDSTTTPPYCVYKVANSVNEKLYIGATSRPLKIRWRQHLRDARTSDFAFHRAILKYGADAFTPEPIEFCPDQETMFARECYWIQYYNTMLPHGYNATAGGEGTVGMHHSEETKQKISNKPITLEFRQRMQDIANVRAQDPAYIAKLSLANTGKHPTEAAIEKIKLARSQQVFTPEVIEKRTQKLRGMTHSALSVAHISAAQEGRTVSPKCREKLSVAFGRLTPEQAAIVKFNAYGLRQKDYAAMFGISPQSINDLVRGRSYTYITREHLPIELRGD